MSEFLSGFMTFFLCENSFKGEEKTGGQGANKFYTKTSSVMLTLSYIELVHIKQNNYD